MNKVIEELKKICDNASIYVENFGRPVNIHDIDETGVELKISVSRSVLKTYYVEVDDWMTFEDSFNSFHRSHNNKTPMPLTCMYGTIVDELSDAYFMNLHSGNMLWSGWVSKRAIIKLEEVQQ